MVGLDYIFLFLPFHQRFNPGFRIMKPFEIMGQRRKTEYRINRRNPD